MKLALTLGEMNNYCNELHESKAALFALSIIGSPSDGRSTMKQRENHE